MRYAWVLLVTITLAGCAASDDAEEPTQEASTAAFDPAAVLAGAPALDFDVEAAVDWWEHISTQYPKHDSWTPQNGEVRAHIIAELEASGFEVEVRTYHATPRDLVPAPEVEPLEIHAVVGLIEGQENPDHRIGLVSHYDTQAATIHGAYDDKSGVATQFHICKALAQVPMNKTLACIFFDAEEQGLVASERYVDDIQDEDYTYDFVLGYDMTGINWPGHDWKMYVMTGGADHVPYLKPLAEQVMHGNDTLAYPREGVEVLDTHDRNSDEMNFKRAGIPIYRFAGGRNAADYPQYHMPQDTVEYVYDFVDGRENFEKGFTTIVEGSYHLALALDQTDAAALAART